MGRLDPDKLHVTYLSGASPDDVMLPRRYTLTHSDFSGDLFLSVGKRYDKKRISSLYTRLMRDEVIAELTMEGECPVIRVCCHVSGGLVFGPASWRYNIFRSELPLVLEAIRYGDKALFEKNPDLDKTPVFIHFQSTNPKFNKIERWGIMQDYENQENTAPKDIKYKLS
jgi:hypothetical protein